MIREDVSVQEDTIKLSRLFGVMKANNVRARVGILGAKNARDGGGGSNAFIGMVHEFGSPVQNIPQRSFLQMPITDKLQQKLAKAGLFDDDMMKEFLASSDIRPYVKKMAEAGVACVLEAFDTRGFGKWKESNMKYKTVKQTLVETQQLRNSITYEVK